MGGNLLTGEFLQCIIAAMYIKLTNANPQFRGNPIAIRVDQIVSVHRDVITRDDGSVDAVTFIFCPPHGTWEVSEDFDTVVDQLGRE